MGMSDAVWERHANPWSFYTRVPILPLIALSIYAREWIGWWCLVPLVVLIVWVFVNPRAFPPPQRFDTYAARGVMGERVWLARAQHPIPARHARAAMVLTVLSGVGVPPLVYGHVVLDPWAVIAGLLLTVGAKMWFIDRMVWLYDEVGDGRFQPQRTQSTPESAA